jgi:lipopolysaccharide export system protein LptA
MRLCLAALCLVLLVSAAAAAQQSGAALPAPPPLQAAPQVQGNQSQGSQAQGTPNTGSQANAAPGQASKGAGAGPTVGGEPSFGGMGPLDAGSSSGPVSIEADDGIEWQRDKNVYVARGNARAARGDMSIAADTLIAHYHDTPNGGTTIYMVEANGNVVVVNKDSKIVGDNAIYDLDKGSALITGKALKATSKESYVTARDSLEYWTKQGAVVARGNAVAADPTRHIQGDMLVGYFHEDAKTGQKKLYQVEATGNVVIDNKGDIAKAAKAVYNMDSDIATLDGGVKITRGKNQLNGEHAIYDTKTGKAKVTGGTGQVKTLLVPGSDKGAGGTLLPGTDNGAGGTKKP